MITANAMKQWMFDPVTCYEVLCLLKFALLSDVYDYRVKYNPNGTYDTPRAKGSLHLV